MRKLAVGVLAGGLFALSAGTAMAASWHNMPTVETGGARFLGGKYVFQPPGSKHGAFEWKGNLQDSGKTDGNNVYVQVRVEGYSWSRYNGKQKKTVALHKLNWDGAALHTDNAYIRVCRDKGSLNPDNCSPTKHYKR
ncbi:hypothetical protein ACIQOU_09290 [Streptomyces sp. NPDC091279]|uniref:hypothetical protein n=1 Tax=unclassified Streptomyces TaxID=2593676 RepID=UPI0037F3416F